MANWNIRDSFHSPDWLACQAEMLWRAHLTNWLWRPRLERRKVRTEVTAECIDKYLDRYAPLIQNLRPETPDTAASGHGESRNGAGMPDDSAVSGGAGLTTPPGAKTSGASGYRARTRLPLLSRPAGEA